MFDSLATLISRNRAWVRNALLAAGVVLLAILIQGRKRELMPLYAQEGELTESVIAQFRSLNLRVEPGSSVLLVDDPFVDWDTKFIADLSFYDRSINVWLQNKNYFSDEEIHEKMK